LLGLFLNPEDGGDVSLLSIACPSQDIPEDRILNCHRCDNFKSIIILAQKPEGKRHLERTGCRWKGNIKIVLRI
jgi:hypothetical protein